jgi:hypothetical protein
MLYLSANQPQLFPTCSNLNQNQNLHPLVVALDKALLLASSDVRREEPLCPRETLWLGVLGNAHSHLGPAFVLISSQHPDERFYLSNSGRIEVCVYGGGGGGHRVCISPSSHCPLALIPRREPTLLPTHPPATPPPFVCTCYADTVSPIRPLTQLMYTRTHRQPNTA